jgi:hypothetical protein
MFSQSANNVGWIDDGPWQGRKCIGCWLVNDAEGAVAARGPYGDNAEAILLADVECSSTRKAEQNKFGQSRSFVLPIPQVRAAVLRRPNFLQFPIRNGTF